MRRNISIFEKASDNHISWREMGGREKKKKGAIIEK